MRRLPDKVHWIYGLSNGELTTQWGSCPASFTYVVNHPRHARAAQQEGKFFQSFRDFFFSLSGGAQLNCCRSSLITFPYSSSWHLFGEKVRDTIFRGRSTVHKQGKYHCRVWGFSYYLSKYVRGCTFIPWGMSNLESSQRCRTFIQFNWIFVL